MATIIKEISIDVARENTFDYLLAKQNDSASRYLKVTLENEGSAFQIDPSSTILLNAEKPDGTYTSTLGTVNEDGTVTVELTNQTLAVEGIVKCDISIVDSEQQKLTTTAFYLQVDRAAVPENTVVSTNEFSVFLDALSNLDDIEESVQAVQSAAASAQEAATRAEQLDRPSQESYSDIILETTNSVAGQPALADCCKAGVKINKGLIIGVTPADVNNGSGTWHVNRAINPTLHIEPNNHINHLPFSGSGITYIQPEASQAFIYAFSGNYVSGKYSKPVQLEYGKEYTFRLKVKTCTPNNSMSWGMGVFSGQAFSSVNNVASTAKVTVVRDVDGHVCHNLSSTMSYSDFASSVPNGLGVDYTVEMTFTSSYTGEAWLMIRNVSAAALQINSSLFCSQNALNMQRNIAINQELNRLGNIYDTVDLKTKIYTKRIGLEPYNSPTPISSLDLTTLALPSTPVYVFKANTEELLEKKTLTSTCILNLSAPQTAFRVLYCTRNPVTTALAIPDLPDVLSDEFVFYTDCPISIAPNLLGLDTMLETKKSSNSYVNKIWAALMQLGGTL